MMTTRIPPRTRLPRHRLPSPLARPSHERVQFSEFLFFRLERNKSSLSPVVSRNGDTHLDKTVPTRLFPVFGILYNNLLISTDTASFLSRSFFSSGSCSACRFLYSLIDCTARVQHLLFHVLMLSLLLLHAAGLVPLPLFSLLLFYLIHLASDNSDEKKGH